MGADGLARTLPSVFDTDELADRLRGDLTKAMARVPLFQPVDLNSAPACRLWRACELCTCLEYRLADAPDPRRLADTALHAWAQRGLAGGEALGDPQRLLDFCPYWVTLAGRRRGTVAVAVRGLGWGTPSLWIASLYLFREERQAGYGTLIMAVLEGVARHLGIGCVRLDTDWLWQGAVRFYLRHGFWVAHWKRGLSLVRHFADPRYRVRTDGVRMDFILGGGPDQPALICARRRGATLIWEEPRRGGHADGADPEPRGAPAPTFALWLAVCGWPLIRGPREWEHRYHWCDTGMPEGLAYKITLFEAEARRCGFRVATPRIPGLVHPPADPAPPASAPSAPGE